MAKDKVASTFERDGGASWGRLTSDAEMARSPEVKELHASMGALMSAAERSGLTVRERDLVAEMREEPPHAELEQATRRYQAALEAVQTRSMGEQGMSLAEARETAATLQGHAETLQRTGGEELSSLRAQVEAVHKGIGDGLMRSVLGAEAAGGMLERPPMPEVGHDTRAGDELALSVRQTGQSMQQFLSHCREE